MTVAASLNKVGGNLNAKRDNKMKNELRYYMNNPCTVLRVFGDGEFTEIKIVPKFEQAVDAQGFCHACMVGSNDGSHPSHTCDEAQEVIDAINDSMAAMPVVVESRLLHKEAIEHFVMRGLQVKLDKANSELNAVRKIKGKVEVESQILNDEYSRDEQESYRLQQELKELTSAVQSESTYLNGLKKERDQLEQEVETVRTANGAHQITTARLRELYVNKVMYEALVKGKVENWEWYSESVPTVSELGQNVRELMADDLVTK